MDKQSVVYSAIKEKKHTLYDSIYIKILQNAN